MGATATGRRLERVDPEGMLPTQARTQADGAKGYGVGSGPRRLMVAVLVDAIRGCVDPGWSQKSLRQHRADWDWLETERTDSPFTFCRICTVLELDPGYVRRLVLEHARRWQAARAQGSRDPALGWAKLRRVYASHRGPLERRAG